MNNKIIEHEIQDAIHNLLMLGYKRENLVIFMGYDAINLIVREIAGRYQNAAVQFNFFNPLVSGTLPKDARMFGVKVRKGYETNKIVIYDETVRHSQYLEILIET